MLDAGILDLIAAVIGCFEKPHKTALGHPPAETVRVLTTAAMAPECRAGPPSVQIPTMPPGYSERIPRTVLI